MEASCRAGSIFKSLWSVSLDMYPGGRSDDTKGYTIRRFARVQHIPESEKQRPHGS